MYAGQTRLTGSRALCGPRLIELECHLGDRFGGGSYGGFRPWFQCACGRRVATLFDAGAGFCCRRCLGLGYACQHVTKSWRAIDRAQSLRLRLGGTADLRDQFPPRPRYMRRTRYERLRERALASQAEGLAALERSLAEQQLFCDLLTQPRFRRRRGPSLLDDGRA
jgi:hypothetical protein